MTLDYMLNPHKGTPKSGPSADRLVNGSVIVKSVKRGQVLYKKGDPSDRVYYIIGGQVILTVPESGKIAEILESGALFGEEALFGGNRTLTATVAAAGKIVFLDPDKIKARADLTNLALRHLSERRERLVDEISCLKFMPPLQRLARLILSLPQVSQGENKIKLPWRKKVMAERIGVRNETFSRLLPGLKENGAVLQGGWLIVTDFNALNRFVSGGPDQWRLRRSRTARSIQ